MILKEATRSELISKSKDKKRWKSKDNCSIANTVADYNSISMDDLFKNDYLIFDVKVQGETDTYDVKVAFRHILKEIQFQIKTHDNKMDAGIIYKALQRTINSGNMYISCTCLDWKYRFAYHSTKNDYNSGPKEVRASSITNPDDDKGAGCKHVMLVLSNLKWLIKISSVIANYINYAKEHMERAYADIIFPVVYGMKYDKAVQLTLDDYDEKGELKNDIASDPALINLSNALGKIRGRFKKRSEN